MALARAVERRSMTEEEREQVTGLVQSSREMSFGAGMVLMFGLLLFLLVGLVLHVLDATKRVEGWVCAIYVAVWLVALVTVDSFSKGDKRRQRRLLEDDLSSGHVTVRTYAIKRHVEVAEFEDFGPYFIAETDCGEVMFLSGQGLYDCQVRGLPRNLRVPYCEVSGAKLSESFDGDLVPPVEQLPVTGESFRYLLDREFCEPVEGSFEEHVARMRSLAADAHTGDDA